MQKSLCKPLISLADIHKAHVGVYDDNGIHEVLRDWDAFGEFLIQKEDVQSELGVSIDAVFLKAVLQCTDVTITQMHDACHVHFNSCSNSDLMAISSCSCPDLPACHSLHLIHLSISMMPLCHCHCT